MKNWNLLNKLGTAALTSFASAFLLTTGCVEHQETYVRPVYPTPVTAPEPPPPPPVVVMPPAVYVPPAPAPAPPPAPVVPMRSANELDEMLAPIALYPDPLLAQLLPAATLPAQVVLADRYVRGGGDLNQVDAQPWDNSLKALARYPATLRMLDDNLAWTTDLGQAFVSQPGDVVDSVQRLRARARELGNLQSTAQQTVVLNEDGVIEILPAAPEIVYVPVYPPEVVYVQPPAPGHLHIAFGAGLVIGAWLNHDWDWHHHELIVWHHDHPRPHDWWTRPPDRRETITVVNQTTIVNQNVTIWHPRTGGAVGARSDRGWSQQDPRTPVPAQHETARPAGAEVRKPFVIAEAPKPNPPREVHAAPTVREVRPGGEVKPAPVIPTREIHTEPPPREPNLAKPLIVKAPAAESTKPVNAQQPPPRQVKPAPQPGQPIPAPKDPRPAPTTAAPKQPAVVATKPPTGAPPTTPRPVASAPLHKPASALTGIESSRVTREDSARGQQSREAMTKPASAPHPAPAPTPPPKANPAPPAATKQAQQAH